MSGKMDGADRSRQEAFRNVEDLCFTLHRVNLVLKGIALIVADQAENPAPSREAVEIVWELTNISKTMVEEASNAAEELAGALSGAAR